MIKTDTAPKRPVKTPDSAETAARRQRRQALLGLLLLIFLAALVGGVIWGGRRVMFRDNPRFKLAKVEIVGGTYWKNREDLLQKRIKLFRGSNLFALDYRDLRRKIEKIPSIEKCEVIRILPDKLQIRIWERIPRMTMVYSRSPWVVDEHGVLMSRYESIPSSNLPIYAGLKRNIKYLPLGSVIKELRPALDLVMMTVRNFPDIKIIHLTQVDRETLKFYMFYRSRDRVYEVWLPIRQRGTPILLSALQTAIINARRHGDSRRRFDLRYGGRVVLSP